MLRHIIITEYVCSRSLSRIGDDSDNAIITTQSLASAADREEEKVGRTVRSGGLLDSSSA